MGLRRSFKPTNLVINSDFSKGTTGWVPSGSTIQASNNIMSIIGNGSVVSPGAVKTLATPYVSGKKIFIKCNFRVTNSSSDRLATILFDGVNYYLGPTQTVITANTWYALSGIITLMAGGSSVDIMLQHRYIDAATANGKVMEVQEVMAIDLTARFGAGLEPDLAWCDNNIPAWFDGTLGGGSFGGIGGLK